MPAHAASCRPVKQKLKPSLTVRSNCSFSTRQHTSTKMCGGTRQFSTGGPDATPLQAEQDVAHRVRTIVVTHTNYGVVTYGHCHCYRLHYFQWQHSGRTFNIWGLTAGILISIAQQTFGRNADFEVTTPGQPENTALWSDGNEVFVRTS